VRDLREVRGRVGPEPERVRAHVHEAVVHGEAGGDVRVDGRRQVLGGPAARVARAAQVLEGMRDHRERVVGRDDAGGAAQRAQEGRGGGGAGGEVARKAGQLRRAAGRELVARAAAAGIGGGGKRGG